jgi:Protein of unknown function (DUF3071)
MRTLHVVGSNAEAGRVVLETSDGLEQFELPIDSALRSALADAPRIAPKPVTRTAEPQISPREIQTRVRAGEPPRDVAEESGAELDWVLRFAGPVLAERARMADEARRAKARRSTTEGQIVVFGEAVDERFAAHGIDPASVDWDAYRREDGQWVLLAHWIGGQAERTAEWAFQLSSRSVTPADDTAADLLSDRPIRPIAPPPPDPEQTTPTLTLAPPLAPGLVAFPAMPDAHTGKLPRTEEEVFDQAQFEEPPLPMDVPNAALPEAPRRVEESDEDKAARAAIPSWDDILLGVRRKRD